MSARPADDQIVVKSKKAAESEYIRIRYEATVKVCDPSLDVPSEDKGSISKIEENYVYVYVLSSFHSLISIIFFRHFRHSLVVQPLDVPHVLRLPILQALPKKIHCEVSNKQAFSFSYCFEPLFINCDSFLNQKQNIQTYRMSAIGTTHFSSTSFPNALTAKYFPRR